MIKKLLKGLLLILISFIFLSNEVSAQEEYSFSYTGNYQEFVIPTSGIYKLEVWGAEGGKSSEVSLGGKGGYSKGYKYFTKGEIVYIYVGGKGETITSGTGGGGYNGGGNAQIGTSTKTSGGGGGATDIRTYIAEDGLWSNTDSLNSRIIVAGGGGGAGHHLSSSSYDYTGGAGGGLTGEKGYQEGGNNWSGNGGTQEEAGYTPERPSSTLGAFGVGGQGEGAVSSAAGGGGGYYGGGGSYCAGGGGGSGYIAGLSSCEGDEPVTIVGTEEIPTYDGEGTMTGNSGDGYAKITLAALDYRFDFEIEGATIYPEVDYSIFDYTVIIPSSVYETKITYDIYDNEVVLGAGKVTLSDSTFKTFVVVDNEGNVYVYNLNIVYNKAILDDVKFEEIEFEFSPYQYDYYLEVANEITSITPEITTNDKYEISSTTLDYGTNKIVIKAYNDEKQETIYNFYITRPFETYNTSYTFTYTGSYQEFVVPASGIYKLEVWGAEGGDSSTVSQGGKGGYSKGYKYFTKGEIIYIYVGGKGETITSGTAGGGFNGGGHAQTGTSGNPSGGGGGATDIRTYIAEDGLWSNTDSLNSRIIVAGGGGGAGHHLSSASYDYTGGAGGGLTGGKGSEGGNNWSGNGGTQEEAGYTPERPSSTLGAFGVGGQGESGASSAAGGGGGYYGGGGSWCAGGGGGSGYITGLSSCEGDEPVTIVGTEEVPTYDGEGTMTGNSGDGYAKISIVGSTEDNLLSTFETSKGTLSPVFESEIYEYILDVDNSVTQLTLTGSSVLEDSSVIGLGLVLIESDSFYHTVSVISNNGFITNYVIHIKRAESDYQYLDNVIINGEELANFDKNIYEYKEILMPYNAEYIYLDAIKGEENQIISGDGLIVFDTNEITVNVLVVSESGDENQAYTFKFIREKSAKLKLVDFNNSFITYDFNSENFSYNLDVPKGVLNLDVTAIPYYEGATVEIIGNDYLDYNEDNVATIKVVSTLEGVETVTYEFKFSKTEIIVDEGYEYTGDYQEFVAPTSGIYLLEVWGAEGASSSTVSLGGKGGYSKGYYKMNAGDTVYIYVGGKGETITSGTGGGGYNGGGNAQIGTYNNPAGGGGGATDIRTYIAEDGLWSNTDSLNSRIIVAGGGGGAGHHLSSASYNYTGGAGGGLIGGKGPEGGNNWSGTGGSQTEAGYTSGRQKTIGSFGIGGQGESGASSAAGGGGGYYGGGGSWCAGGGGGSGYVNGLLTYAYDEPVTIIGTELIPTHDKTSMMTGNSGDGYARITLVKEVSSDNYLATLVLNDGDIPLDFKTSQTKYNVTLTETDIKLKIDATPKDEGATVSGTGTFDIAPGNTVKEITVTASDGSIKIYTLNIYRPGSKDPYPERIDINKMPAYLCDKNDKYCNYTYSSEKDTYNITLPFDIEEVEIRPILKSKYQKVIYRKVIDEETTEEVTNGNIILNDETTTYEVEIISEDESQSKKFTYTFTRDLTGNNYLQSLVITNPSIEFEFNPRTYEYYLTIDGEHDSYDVEATTQSSKATVKVEGNTNLKLGMNDCIITVTAENGSTKNYIIHMYKKQDTNVFLNSLVVKNGEEELELIPTFSDVLNNYSVEVGPVVDKVTIEATAAGTNAKVAGTGEKELASGVNQFEITVTSESGDVNTYVISIIKAKNNNSKLANLEVEGYTITPNFDPDTKEYYLEVGKSINELNVIVTPEETTTTYTIRGNNNLNNNLNEIVITSIAEDKTYTIYKIYVTKEMSTNNYLSGIKVTGGTPEEEFELTPTFDKDTQSYTITFEKEISTVKVEGILEDKSAIVTGNGTYYLVAGDNPITLSVKSETGEERIYKVTITKAKDNDATLKSVTNNQNSEVSIPEDTTLGYDYLINVQYEVNTIEITGIPNSSKATVVGNRTYSLKVGNNDITLSVTAENGITENYKVRVVRDASDNDDLDFLYVHEGGLSPIFNETTIYYEVKVPNDATIPLNIEAITEDENATYEIIGNNGTLEVGVAKEIIVKVTAQKGNTKDYTLSVTRQAATEENLALESLITNRGEVQPTFSPDTLNYTLEVENEISDITVTGTALSENVTVKGNGTYNLNVGKNAIPIFVIGTDGVQRDYQIVVTRKKSKDASLANLVVKSHTLSPTFMSGTTSYSLTTSNTSLEFTTITPTETEATYEIIGNENFTTGENTVTIRVTAPDGETTQDYILTVTRTGSKNNNLASLSVDGYTLTPNFHKGVTFYAVEVANDLNSIIINATAEDTTASIDGIGLKTITTGENYFDIVVTSEAGTSKTYTILVTKEASDNNYLASLYTSTGDLTPDFDKLENKYEITVPYDIEEIEIYGSTEDANATVTGLETHNLEVGENNIEVIVTSESGKANIYEIKVTRKEINSAYLTSLNVEGYDLDIEFNKEIFDYNVTVNSETTELNINYVKEDVNATVEITGNENFDIGMNEVKLTVTASDGVTKNEYILYVNRMLSTNNYLQYITISEGVLVPDFTQMTLDYTVNVGAEIESITIDAKAVDSNATITSGIGTFNLNKGENKIAIKVKSMIGVTRTYTVNVIRAKSSDATLKELYVVNTNNNQKIFNDFDYNIDTYDLNVASSVKYINILAYPNDEAATISGDGIKELVAGLNTYVITVTAEDGSTKDYTINITREKSTNNNVLNIIPSIGTFTETFNPDIKEYTLKVSETDLFLEFTVELEDMNASVTGNGRQAIPNGTSERVITVTAEDGSINEYTITVIKENISEARLESLEIKDYELDFDPDTFTYNLKVSGAKRELLASEITAIPKDSEATVNLMGDIKLSEGIINVYTIEVIAKDGYTTQEYILNITRDSELHTLRSDIYDIIRDNEEDYVTKINVTKLENFKNSFQNENEYLKVYKDVTEIVDEVNIGTGYIIKLEINNIVYDTLRIIVTGDVTGDGKVDVSDSVDLNNVILKKKVFEGYTFKAGDVTGDGKIDVSDSVKLNNYILKKIASLINEES